MVNPAEYFAGEGVRRMSVAFFTASNALLAPITDSIYLSEEGIGVREDASLPPWQAFDLSASKSLPKAYKVVLFGARDGTIQISEYSAPAIEKIAWRSKAGGIVFRFDNGKGVPDGAYYCGFEAFAAGESIRTVRLMLNDSGAYDFYQTGVPLPEEDLSSYRLRRKRDRMNNEILLDLARKLGFCFAEDEFWECSDGFRVYKVRSRWCEAP